DLPLRIVPPADVERVLAAEEHHPVEVDMVVEPPGGPAPIGGVVSVEEPGEHDASAGAGVAVRVTYVPDVVGVAVGVAGALQAVLMAELVEARRAVARADVDAAEGVLQGLEDRLAQPAAGLDEEVAVHWDVGQPICR